MKKNRFLMFIIIIFMSFCCGAYKVGALPNCDLKFYNMEITSNEAGADLTCGANTLCAKYCPQGSILCYDTGLAAWGEGSRIAGASMIVSEKNTVKSYGFTIYEEYADSNNKKKYRAVCNYSQNIDNAAAGSNLFVLLNIGANEKDSSGGYKYGHIFSVHFSGTYENESGNIVNYSSDNVTLRRSGQYYSTNRTAKTTTKKGQTTTALKISSTTGKSGAPAGIGKASSTKKITEIGSGNSDMACDTIGDLFDEYWPYVMVIIPILLIIMMAIDFFKAMAINDADALKKAGTNAVKRTIATVIALALPALLRMVFGLFGIDFCL